MMVGLDGYITLTPFLRMYYRNQGYDVYIRMEIYFFNWVEIGSVTLSPTCNRMDLPPFVLSDPIFGTQLVKTQGSVALNLAKCTIDLSLYVYIVRIVDTTLAFSIPYAIPFPVNPPAWNNVKIRPEDLLGAVTRGTRIDSVPGAKSVNTDPTIQSLLQGLLYMTGGGNVINDHIAGAQRIRSITSSEDSLTAIGLQITGGIGAGLSAGAGLFGTSNSEYGVYGVAEADLGVLAHIGGSLVGTVFWGSRDKTALQNFQGVAALVGTQINADTVPAGVGLVVYLSTETKLPLGFSVDLGVGFGSPFEFYAGLSATLALSFTGQKESVTAQSVSYEDLIAGKVEIDSIA
jgi:hypothetical protein